MNISPITITDNGATELSWRLVMVTSLLLGFNAHGNLCNLTSDYKALTKKAQWPEKVVFCSARVLGMIFLITAIVILESRPNAISNCHLNTRLAICTFFLSHGLHHLQFGLRLLSLYRYRWDLLVLQLTGCVVILGLCLFAAIESESGIVLPSNGCVLVFDSNTLPDKTSLLILAGLSVCHQVFTSLVAIVKLYQKPDPYNKDGLPQSIYTALMIDGIPYWIARLISVAALVLLPIAFFIDHTMLLMTAFSIHTALDIELSALILRSSPLCGRGDRRSSFGVLGLAKEDNGGEKQHRLALSITSRLSSLNMFPKDKKEQVLRVVSDPSMTASSDRLPQYNYSLASKDWGRSENTLVVKDESSEQQQHQPISTDTALTPPTRPPRTKSTRITQSLRTMLSSSTSRYASVIHFYQDSPTSTPQAIEQSEWTRTSITPSSRPPSISGRSVKATPPPGWI